MRKLLVRSLFALAVGASPVIVTALPAHAEVVHIAVAPPRAEVEVVPVAPSPAHVWVGGFWRWDAAASRHVWVAGRYELPPHPGHIWFPNRWVRSDAEWVFVPGHWAAPPVAPTIEVAAAPPPVQAEVISPAPSANHFWIGGHWRWDGVRYVWAPGFWAVHQPGWIWEPAHWAAWGGRWHFILGHWRRP